MKFQQLSLLLSFVLLSMTAAVAQSADEAAIKKVIEDETRAWNAGDTKAQMAYWQIQPYSRMLITGADGVHYDFGVAEMIKFAGESTPTGGAGARASATNTNYLIHVSGNMAWSSHDQVSTLKEDGTKNYTHEMRILEKIGGAWKIVGMSVHQYKP